MRDPLALYSAVMGRLWEEERIRGQRADRGTPTGSELSPDVPRLGPEYAQGGEP